MKKTLGMLAIASLLCGFLGACSGESTSAGSSSAKTVPSTETTQSTEQTDPPALSDAPVDDDFTNPEVWTIKTGADAQSVDGGMKLTVAADKNGGVAKRVTHNIDDFPLIEVDIASYDNAKVHIQAYKSEGDDPIFLTPFPVYATGKYYINIGYGTKWTGEQTFYFRILVEGEKDAAVVMKELRSLNAAETQARFEDPAAATDTFENTDQWSVRDNAVAEKTDEGMVVKKTGGTFGYVGKVFEYDLRTYPSLEIEILSLSPGASVHILGYEFNAAADNFITPEEIREAKTITVDVLGTTQWLEHRPFILKLAVIGGDDASATFGKIAPVGD